MRKRIIEYGMSWNPVTNGGVFGVKMEDGTRKKVPANSVGEYAAIALILNRAPVYVDDNDRIITDWKPLKDVIEN